MIPTLICTDCVRRNSGTLDAVPYYDMRRCHFCGDYRSVAPVSLYRWPHGKPQPLPSSASPINAPCRDEECRICQA